jgi:carboxypeptidase C (cathepsin A)
MGLPEALRGNIRITHYESGHMIYIRRSEQKKFKRDIGKFIKEAANVK